MAHMKEHIPSFIDKQLLVWYKKYPTKDQIPNSVNENMMKKVHNKARIHGSLIMMGLTIVGYIGIALKSRKAAQRGESIEKINEQFHKDWERKHK